MLIGQQVICFGVTKDYGVDIAENSGVGTLGSIYSWRVLEPAFNGNIAPSSSSGNRVSVNWGNSPPGNYTLQVVENNGDCLSTKQLTVNLISISSNLASEYRICNGGNPITIDAGYNASYTYSWTVPAGVVNPGNVAAINTNIPGTYSLVINNGICSQNFSTTLSVSDLPVITSIKEIADGSIEVFATGGDRPLSYSLDGINWQTSHIFTQLISGRTYTVFVRNSMGCIGDSKMITLFFMPNVITPPSDGFNDRLNLKGIENFSNAHLQIYDRYGQLVFDSVKEKTFKWNGYYLGRPLPTASYWYVLDLRNDGQKKTGYILVKNRN